MASQGDQASILENLNSPTRFSSCSKHSREMAADKQMDNLEKAAFCEEQRSHFVVISVKIKERFKNISHTMVFVHLIQK